MSHLSVLTDAEASKPHLGDTRVQVARVEICGDLGDLVKSGRLHLRDARAQAVLAERVCSDPTDASRGTRAEACAASDSTGVGSGLGNSNGAMRVRGGTKDVPFGLLGRGKFKERWRTTAVPHRLTGAQ